MEKNVRPRILVTRKLPDAVHSRLVDLFGAELNETDILNAIETLNNNPLQTITNLATKLQVCPKTLTRAMGKV